MGKRLATDCCASSLRRYGPALSQCLKNLTSVDTRNLNKIVVNIRVLNSRPILPIHGVDSLLVRYSNLVQFLSIAMFSLLIQLVVVGRIHVATALRCVKSAYILLPLKMVPLQPLLCLFTHNLYPLGARTQVPRTMMAEKGIAEIRMLRSHTTVAASSLRIWAREGKSACVQVRVITKARVKETWQNPAW